MLFTLPTICRGMGLTWNVFGQIPLIIFMKAEKDDLVVIVLFFFSDWINIDQILTL